MAEKLTLPFGCNRALAAQARRPLVAWGARMIAPDDLLWDRQGCAGGEEGGPERTALLGWLSAGAGEAARAKARELRLGTGMHDLDGRSQAMVSLYRDERGEVMGSPQGSRGYVYIAAWLFEHAPPVEHDADAVLADPELMAKVEREGGTVNAGPVKVHVVGDEEYEAVKRRALGDSGTSTVEGAEASSRGARNPLTGLYG